MQTFLPVSSFTETARILDWRRLGKQRVEALQLINALTGKSKGWSNHPAAKMWEGHLDALRQYMNIMIEEWIRRGYNNTMKLAKLPNNITYPCWLGNEEFHAAHRSNLLRKDKPYYSEFGWTEGEGLPYIWPLPKSSNESSDDSNSSSQE